MSAPWWDKFIGDIMDRLDRKKPVPKPRPVPTPPSPIDVAPEQDWVFALTNAARVNNHLPTLVLDAKLCSMAQAWAMAMAGEGSLEHGDWLGRFERVYPNAAGAENVATAPTPPEAMSEWLSSPTHRANILGDYNAVGVGAARARDGTAYWCMDLARL